MGHRRVTPSPEPQAIADHYASGYVRAEIAEAGFAAVTVYGVEGPGWLVSDFDAWWGNGEYRDRLLQLAGALEIEPSISAASAHLMAMATR